MSKQLKSGTGLIGLAGLFTNTNCCVAATDTNCCVANSNCEHATLAVEFDVAVAASVAVALFLRSRLLPSPDREQLGPDLPPLVPAPPVAPPHNRALVASGLPCNLPPLPPAPPAAPPQSSAFVLHLLVLLVLLVLHLHRAASASAMLVLLVLLVLHLHLPSCCSCCSCCLYPCCSCCLYLCALPYLGARHGCSPLPPRAMSNYCARTK
jgi:hypothetical protein